jgi:TRAP-type uncharacterized transport system fused permease subunit
VQPRRFDSFLFPFDKNSSSKVKVVLLGWQNHLPKDWEEIIYSLATACVGTVCLAGGIQGWFLKPITAWQSILLVAAALGLIKPGWITDLLGAILMITVIATVKFGFYKKEEKTSPAPAR